MFYSFRFLLSFLSISCVDVQFLDIEHFAFCNCAFIISASSFAKKLQFYLQRKWEISEIDACKFWWRLLLWTDKWDIFRVIHALKRLLSRVWLGFWWACWKAWKLDRKYLTTWGGFEPFCLLVSILRSFPRCRLHFSIRVGIQKRRSQFSYQLKISARCPFWHLCCAYETKVDYKRACDSISRCIADNFDNHGSELWIFWLGLSIEVPATAIFLS